MRLTAFFLSLALGFAAAAPVYAEDPTGSIAPGPTADDLACAHARAGTVPAMPAPFDLWVVLVCASDGQALVPVEGMVWLSHGTNDAVSILALPPGATPVPRSEDFDPRYGVRFKELLGAEVKGKKFERIKGLLKAALGDEPPPHFDRIFQLDAISIIYDMRYNIYFYIDGRRPRAAIACIDECKQALLMDVLTTDEMKARVAGLR
ncbi:MAG TPA: hypothetical protein VF449_05805 [Parvibaculum sp.]